MRPHAQDMNDALVFINGIDKAMFDVDSAGVKAFEISHKFFAWWRRLKRIVF